MAAEAKALKWDGTGERFYETGVKNAVLYPYDKNQVGHEYRTGVAWNGLTGVTETPSGAEETSLYADDMKYLSLRSSEDFGCTIEAYTYPDEWMACDGSAEAEEGVIIGQQVRNSFGLCYKTTVGNDTEGNSYGYKLHLVYGCTASPSERAYATINDSPEAITFSWEVTTIPVKFSSTGDYADYKPVSILTIDSNKVDPTDLATLEAKLYGKDPTTPSGTDGVVPELPSPEEVLAIFA